jgi:hypothetical protein
MDTGGDDVRTLRVVSLARTAEANRAVRALVPWHLLLRTSRVTFDRGDEPVRVVEAQGELTHS